ncbi:MAG: dipicolinate synthase subunit DpsA [Oscillospiraceae bacterium]
MINDLNFLVIGGDKRQIYLYEFLLDRGCNCYTYGLFEKDYKSLKILIEKSDVIILPLPFSKDNIYIYGENKKISVDEILDCDLKNKSVFIGLCNNIIREKLEKKFVKYVDYYQNDIFSLLNAIPTAEGTIKSIIENTDFTIFKSNILITGYGKVASCVAESLYKLGANITISARSIEQRALAYVKGYKDIGIDDIKKLAYNFDVVINTPNAEIFNKKTYDSFNKETFFIDLASEPGGFSSEVKHLKNVIAERGIPGKVAPKTAGEYIGKTVLNYIGGND